MLGFAKGARGVDLGLKNRVAVVTGSSSGIGKAAALLLAQEGARVAATYHTQRDKAESVVAQIRDGGSDALAVQLDLASLESVQGAMALVIDRWGHIDILVNNAVDWGSRLPANMPAFEDVPADEWRALLRANSEGPYVAIQAAVPSMRARGWGRIVNVSSGIAVDGLPGAGPYAVAKAGLHGLTRTLSKELGPAGILVNVVMPGATLTERNLAWMPDTIRDRIAEQSPIRRMLPPKEVVPMIVFLCSAANTAVTGEIIRASGGIT
jgi:3-oxoacyl-[acyl-carrier protein] reductase